MRQPELKPRTVFLTLFALTILWSILVAALLFRHSRDFDEAIGYGVYPATRSLLAGAGLTICSDTLAQTIGNPICFHSARMPLAEWVLALGIKLCGLHILPLAILKTILLLLPLELTIFIVCRRFTRAPRPLLLAALLLLLPFAIAPFWQDVVSLGFEEAYSYSFIALAFAMALFRPPTRGLGGGIIAGLTFAAILLSKSSMILVASVLLFGCLLTLRGRSTRLLAVLLAFSAPFSWILYQHHASGRYALGTSLDGFNLHMGNSPNFLRDYPPYRSLDDTAAQLNAGHTFAGEWPLNDYHHAAALAFIRAHPGTALRGTLRKARIVFFSVRSVGGWSPHGLRRLVEVAGMVLFRLLFWTAILLAIVSLVRSPANLRRPSVIFLLFLAAAVTPYLLGFAYTRHISILIYPTVLFWCRALLPRATHLSQPGPLY